MPSDIAVGTYSGPLPGGAPVARKPVYLVVLEEQVGKNIVMKRFITIDKPEIIPGFVQVKGVFTDLSEDEISSKYLDVLASSSKDLFVEIMFPQHKINNIRNLVFRAK
jgi:hypothetical protein